MERITQCTVHSRMKKEAIIFLLHCPNTNTYVLVAKISSVGWSTLPSNTTRRVSPFICHIVRIMKLPAQRRKSICQKTFPSQRQALHTGPLWAHSRQISGCQKFTGKIHLFSGIRPVSEQYILVHTLRITTTPSQIHGRNCIFWDMRTVLQANVLRYMARTVYSRTCGLYYSHSFSGTFPYLYILGYQVCIATTRSQIHGRNCIFWDMRCALQQRVLRYMARNVYSWTCGLY
jgi:hypothetical protein